MNNCLITKLNGAVNDSSLHKLGVADVAFHITSASQRGLHLSLLEETKVTTDKSCSILNNSGSQEYASGTEFTLSTGNHYVKPDTINDVVVVSIFNKYASVYRLGTNAGSYAEGIKLLESCDYMTKLASLQSTNGGEFDMDLMKQAVLSDIYINNATKITGKLSSLGGTELTNVRMTSDDNGLTGNLSELQFASNCSQFNLNICPGITGHLTRLYGLPLTSMRFGMSKVEGVLEDYLAQWYSLSPSSISLTLTDKITFHGVPLPSAMWAGSASKSGGVLTFKNASNVVLATYDGTSWTYA